MWYDRRPCDGGLLIGAGKAEHSVARPTKDDGILFRKSQP